MTDVIESRSGRIVTLTLNRPDRLNAISPEMIGLLYESISRLDRDPEVGVIVLTGAGRAFCAGGDVKAMAERGVPDRNERLEHLRRAHKIPLAIRQCSKVVVAMINGPATGAGLGIAAICDLRIAARSARFGAAFAKIGVASDFGLSYSLTKTVGPSLARQLLLSAEIFPAERALQIGLVTHVVDDEALPEETRKIAALYAEGPSIAYKLLKENLLAAETVAFPDLLELEAQNQATALLTDDHQEAVAAFLEKRKGRFSGK
jgi:2-(1,2-epoxy-1,2-dihydrophenyl)acetyl-CoA isomerase